MAEANEKGQLSNLTDKQLKLLEKFKEKNNLSDAMEMIVADKEISKDELVTLISGIKGGYFKEMTVIGQGTSHIEQITPEKQEILLQSFEGLLSVMMKNGFSIRNSKDIVFLNENGYDVSKLGSDKELIGKSVYQKDDNTLDFRSNHSITFPDRIVLEDVDVRDISAGLGTGIILLAAAPGFGFVILGCLILGYGISKFENKIQGDRDRPNSKEILSKLGIKVE